MNRRSFLGGVSAFAVTAAASYLAFIQPADDQITELEAQVTDLDTRVDALETQVAEIEPGEGVIEAPAQNASTSGESTVLEGVGTMVPDPFPLAPGRFRVTATVQASNGFASIIVEVIDPTGASELVFNEFGDAAGEWSGSTIYNAPADGDYIVSISNTDGPWSLTFEPF